MTAGLKTRRLLTQTSRQLSGEGGAEFYFKSQACAGEAPRRPTAPLIKYIFKETMGAPPGGPPPLIRPIRHPGPIALFPLMFPSQLIAGEMLVLPFSVTSNQDFPLV